MQIVKYSYWRASTSLRGASQRTVEFLVRPRLIRLCWYILLVLLPFGTRVLVTHVTKGFHEYESLFLYGSDLFLGLLLLLAFGFHRHRAGEWHEGSLKLLAWPLLIFVFVSGVSVALAPSYLLSVYSLFRLLAMILLAWFVMPLIVNNASVLRKSAILLAILAVVQAGVGIFQFSGQGSLGLSGLGESYLDPAVGLGSQVPFGAGLLRAYGTFPHPNILAAFLLVGLFALVYFYIQADWHLYRYDKQKSVADNFHNFVGSRYFYIRLLVVAGMFVTLLGLALTFSRGGWVSGAIGLVVLLLLLGARRHFRSTARFLVVLVLIIAAIYLVLGPVLSERATFKANEDAVIYRLAYSEVGLDLIKDQAFGVGIGNQVLYGVNNKVYQNLGMTRVFEWEPVHNLYLLIGAETGVVGVLAFVGFLVVLFWQLMIRKLPLIKLFVVGALVSLLVFGLFDHFLWTIQAGRLMLWITIGLAVSMLLWAPERRGRMD